MPCRALFPIAHRCAQLGRGVLLLLLAAPALGGARPPNALEVLEGRGTAAPPPARVLPREPIRPAAPLPGAGTAPQPAAPAVSAAASVSVPPAAAAAAPAWPLDTGSAAGACPTVPADQPVALRAAVQRALCLDPRTRVSWGEVMAEAAERLAVQAEGAPRAAWSIDAGRQWERQHEPGEPTSRLRGPVHAASAELRWTVLDFGQSRLRAQAAEQAVRAAIGSHDEWVQTVILDAVQTHQAALQAQAQLAAQRAAERLLRELLAEALRPRRPGGALEPLGERQARTELARLTIDLRRAEAEWARARGSLAMRLGLPPTAALVLPAPDPAAPGVDQARDLVGLVGQALQTHPVLVAARARLQGAETAVALARREDLPQVELRAGWQRGREPGAGTSQTHGVALSLSVPLGNAAERRSRVQRAEARLAQARAEEAQQRRDTALAVWTSYQTLREEAAALEMSARYRREAGALLAEELQAFRAGESDMFDVLDAHGSVLEAESGQLASQTALTIARVRLAAALGRLGLDSRDLLGDSLPDLAVPQPGQP